jgi:hypothetical protein
MTFEHCNTCTCQLSGLDERDRRARKRLREQGISRQRRTCPTVGHVANRAEVLGRGIEELGDPR